MKTKICCAAALTGMMIASSGAAANDSATGNRGLSPIIFHRSCLTQSEEYVLACYRYIELNPVRAGMVNQPKDYRWSSYHTNALGKPSKLIVPHEEYLRIARDQPARLESYRALFKAHLDEEIVGQIRSATNGNFALGSERFQKEIEAALGRRARRGQSGRPSSNQIDQEYQLDLL